MQGFTIQSWLSPHKFKEEKLMKKKKKKGVCVNQWAAPMVDDIGCV